MVFYANHLVYFLLLKYSNLITNFRKLLGMSEDGPVGALKESRKNLKKGPQVGTQRDPFGAPEGASCGPQGSRKTKKICLVFAAGPESDGNRGNICYGA
jgi:hypothetical protein